MENAMRRVGSMTLDIPLFTCMLGYFLDIYLL